MSCSFYEPGCTICQGFFTTPVDIITPHCRGCSATGEKARHIRERGFDNRYYRDLIIDLIGKHQPVSREEINRLLLDKLPEVLNEEQKIDGEKN
jgi:hypothetical protein